MTLMIEEVYSRLVKSRKKEPDLEKSRLAISKAAKWLTTDRKPGLLLYGTVGSGKTTLADSIWRIIATLKPGERVYRKSAIELTEEAKNNPEGFKNLVKSKLLFIDDLGEEPVTIKNYGNETSPLVELIYHRYDKQLFTVLTTNLTTEEFRSNYGVRVEDRMAEMFDRIYYNIPSFRR